MVPFLKLSIPVIGTFFLAFLYHGCCILLRLKPIQSFLLAPLFL